MNGRAIVCEDLNLAIDDWRRQGFRLDTIFPADEPRVARLSNGDLEVELRTPGAPDLPGGLPPFLPAFVLTHAGKDGAAGRAGMTYRDLIPGRLGGRYIASHISIADGGPVADWVHYHRVALQLIVVRSGWVRVVYQGQGDPFVMRAGDLVLQPPGIRHRVLESSPGLEVIEISAPALHETLADHELALPTGTAERSFGGQRFLRHAAADTMWTAYNGAEAQETELWRATNGVADARTVRPGPAPEIAFEPHDGELVFGFVMGGSARLAYRGSIDLRPADAFVIPPGQPWSLGAMSADFRLLHVTTERLE